MGEGTKIPNDRGRLWQAFQLIRALVRYHKKTFFTAVAGAAVFAACTVASAMVVRLIIDEVINPRFNEGSVALRKVVLILGALIVLGFVRAAGVVVRRTWAGRTTWRVTETITTDVIDRLTEQPAPWHRTQSTGDLITRAGVDAEGDSDRSPYRLGRAQEPVLD